MASLSGPRRQPPRVASDREISGRYGTGKHLNLREKSGDAIPKGGSAHSIERS